jgi:hypothetical protein
LEAEKLKAESRAFGCLRLVVGGELAEAMAHRAERKKVRSDK